MKIYLASASPRRRELLTQMGLDFEVRVSDCDESTDLTAPDELVYELALRKATAVASTLSESDFAVIGSDTVVALDGRIIGKPRDAADAVETLLALSGKAHSVFTGIAIVTPTRTLAEVSETRIHFVELTRAEAEAYVATGEPLDKAGSYGIQGRGGVFVERIDGDYFATVGLPISRLRMMLREL